MSRWIRNRRTANARLKLSALEDRTTPSVSVVRDINTGVDILGADPDKFISFGAFTYFSAGSPGEGVELWRTDGTSAGTTLVADINRGSLSSDPQSLTVSGGLLYFSANDGLNGRELWRSNGTSSGTVLVRDLLPGSGSSFPNELIDFAGTLYYSANDGVNGPELWSTLGTTHSLFNLNTTLGAGSSPESLALVGSTLYFSANALNDGAELWSTNGVTATQVLDIESGSVGSNPGYLVNVSGTLYFSATTTLSGKELWKSNGTATGTVLVTDLVAGSGSPAYFYELVNGGGTLFFRASAGSGPELYRSQGTAATTFLVEDIIAGTNGPYPSSLTFMNGFMYFRASGTSGNAELWRATSASNSAVLVRDINPAASSNPVFLVNVSNTLFFAANDGTNGVELWKSDGTSAGTVIVENLASGSANSLPAALANIGGVLYFAAAPDGNSALELHISTGGTAATTGLVRNIFTANSSAIGSLSTANLNGTIFFSANDGTNGNELWRSNGTSTGTSLVANINPGSANSNPIEFTTALGKVFFRANDGTTGVELWATDGTTTAQVLDINGGANSSNPQSFIEYNGFVYFLANTASHGQELWRTDGTAVGTTLVADINPGTVNSAPTDFAVVGGVLYFSATTTTAGRELWKTDGVTTTLVRDINPLSLTADVSQLLNANGTLYFFANDGVNGLELWTSDGTSIGTTIVSNIAPGLTSSVTTTTALVLGGSGVVFPADDGVHGIEPWTSNGTDTGTRLIEDILPGAASSNPGSLTSDGTGLYAAATDPVAGRELWAIGADAATTFRVSDMFPGPFGSSPSELTNIGGMLHFAANDGTNGREIWRLSNNSAALLEETVSGTGDGNPMGFVESSGVLMFFATNPTAGFELHRINGGLPPFITSNSGAYTVAVSQPENTTAIGTITAIDTNPSDILTFSIVGGDDAADVSIHPTSGVLSFNSLPDFENPVDSNSDNVYQFVVRVSDGVLTDQQVWTVAVTDRAHTLTTVYVTPAAMGKSDGTILSDVDPYTSGSQPGTVGINTFLQFDHAEDVLLPGGKLVAATQAYGFPWKLQDVVILHVGSGGSISFSGAISGTSGFRKTGSGQITLSSGLNSFSGPVIIEQGALRAASDADLGAISNIVTLSPLASLEFTSSTLTTRTLNLNGGTWKVTSPVTMIGATVAGGVLTSNGSGITTASGNTSTFLNVTIPASMTITSQGPDLFQSTVNNGHLNAASPSAIVTLSNVVNNPAGRITLNTATLSDFSTLGVLTITNAVTESGSGGLVFGGGSLTTIAATASLTSNNSGGVLLSNAYVRNNGTFGNPSKNIVVEFGGKLEGTGTFGSVVTQNGGVFSPGSSPGPATTHQLNISPGGRLEFEITDASGTEAALSGWDRINVASTAFGSPSIEYTATASSKYTIVLAGRANSGDFNSPGAIANFNGALSYAWKFADGSAAAQNGTFDANAFAVDTSEFSNSFTGGFSVERRDAGKNLYVVYTPVAGPVITSFVVNGGDLQRSRLTNVVVNFASPVDAATLQTPGAVSFTRTQGGSFTVDASNGLQIAPASGLVSSITLTFANIVNSGVEHGSLADGRWQLNIPSGGYQSPLNGTQLRRLFGDVNGDGTVDGGSDFALFKFQTAANDPFDWNNDGTVDGPTDFAQFGLRFGKTV